VSKGRPEGFADTYAKTAFIVQVVHVASEFDADGGTGRDHHREQRS
jgi:hypothetical protein